MGILIFYPAEYLRILRPALLFDLQIGKDRQLNYDPCCLKWFSKGEYVVIGGANKQCTLYTKEGVNLGLIAEQKSWAWACAVKPNSSHVVIETNVPFSVCNLFLCWFSVIKFSNCSKIETTADVIDMFWIFLLQKDEKLKFLSDKMLCQE